MTSEAPGLTRVLERLERVEQELRWWRRLGAACAVMLAFVTLLGATRARIPDEIRAKRFVLQDGQGKERARLEVVAPDWTALTFEGEAGTTARVELGVTGSAPGLILRDLKEKEATEAGLRVQDGGPLMWLEGKGQRARLGMLGGGKLTLTLLDRKTQSTTSVDTDALEMGANNKYVRVDADGLFARADATKPLESPEALVTASSLAFKDKGQVRATAGLWPDGSPRIALYDANKNTRAVFGSTELETRKTRERTRLPESSLVLFDKDGKVIWQAP